MLIARRIWVIREHLNEDWALALDCYLALGRLWQDEQRDGEYGQKASHRPNYNSTKLCFVYFGVYRGNGRDKRNTWFDLLPQAQGGGEAVDSRAGFGRSRRRGNGENSLTCRR